jgi:predicted RNA-binding protein Jag
MAIYSGETVNDAIEKGLKDLGIDKKHAEITVIQQPKPGILGKFSKEAKVEIIKLSDADLEKKKKFKKFGIIGGAAFFLILLLSIFLSEVFTSTKNSDNNEISAPIASTELTSQNYKTVVQQFEDAGFINIKTTKIEDLITGWLIEDGEIEKVTIDGKEDFEDGDFFSNDVRVDIAYHTFPPETEHPDDMAEKITSSESESVAIAESISKAEAESIAIAESVAKVEAESIAIAESAANEEWMTSVNQSLDNSLTQMQGWALGLLDRDGYPTENGTPDPYFAWALFIVDAQVENENKAIVLVGSEFMSLSEYEKTSIIDYLQNVIQNELYGASTPNSVHITIYASNNIIGSSKILNMREYKWKD